MPPTIRQLRYVKSASLAIVSCSAGLNSSASRLLRCSCVLLWLAMTGVVALAAEPAPPNAASLSSIAPVGIIVAPTGLESDVRFWIRVYTEITSNEGFLHDERNLNVIYGVVRVPQELPQKERLRLIEAARDEYAAMLRMLATLPALTRDYAQSPVPAPGLVLASALLGYDPVYAAELAAPDALRDPAAAAAAARAAQQKAVSGLSGEQRRVLALWGPDVTAARLSDAARSVRFQLGQADRFKAGLQRSGAWEAHIAETLATMGLPAEIAALPHVESSFNPAAYSKVGAAGLWQFMRSTGKRYMRVDDAVDERLDPFRSSEAAAQLLSYNYRLLGSWPLAITAYNHGAAGIRRAQDALGTSDYLAINRNYRGATFGFASRNFFPSFLAALAIDRQPEKYFGALQRAADSRYHEIAMPAFATIAAVERATGVSRDQLSALNPALRSPVFSGNRLIPRGYRLRLPIRLAAWDTNTLQQHLGANELYAAQVQSRSHTVTRGDTLAKVARRYGVSAVGLAERNGMAVGAKLKHGQRLQLADIWPPRLGSAAAAALLAAQAASATSAVADANARINAEPAVEAVAAASGAKAAVPAAAAPSAADTAQTVAARNAGGAADTPRATSRTTPVPTTAVSADAIASVEQADAGDYSVARDNTIRVIGTETLGHYADWLNVSAARLRRINHLKSRAPLLLGRRFYLDFSRVDRASFEAARRAFHAQTQAAYFESRRIVGSEVYVVRRGDTLWSVTQHYSQLPVWLLQQYNPDADLSELRAGTQLVVPRVE